MLKPYTGIHDVCIAENSKSAEFHTCLIEYIYSSADVEAWFPFHHWFCEFVLLSWSGVFLPGLLSPDECKSKDGLLNKPLCIAWSSMGRNHYIPLVGIKGKAQLALCCVTSVVGIKQIVLACILYEQCPKNCWNWFLSLHTLCFKYLELFLLALSRHWLCTKHFLTCIVVYNWSSFVFI